MKRIAWIGVIVIAATELIAVGCNAVLGNESGTLAAPIVDATTGNDVVTITTVDAGDSGTSCGNGEKNCFGVCKSVEDTTVGCSDVSCTVCPSPAHESASCVGGAGGFVCSDSCRTGFADCNADAGDGCETDLSLTTSCGECSIDCSNAAVYTPQPFYCVPSSDAGTFACSGSCVFPNTVCGANCFDLTNNASHCGSCGNDCSIANGVAKCSNSACVVESCDPGYHNCGGACVSNSDIKHCGPTSCTTCPSAGDPSNSSPACVADMNGNYSCSYTCNSGNVACGSTCCASGQSCISNTCTTPVVCAPPTIPCPSGCTAACTMGCIDPTSTTTCGGDCQAANDCTMSGDLCCSSLVGGTGGVSYSCQYFDSGVCNTFVTP